MLIPGLLQTRHSARDIEGVPAQLSSYYSRRTRGVKSSGRAGKKQLTFCRASRVPSSNFLLRVPFVFQLEDRMKSHGRVREQELRSREGFTDAYKSINTYDVLTVFVFGARECYCWPSQPQPEGYEALKIRKHSIFSGTALSGQRL